MNEIESILAKYSEDDQTTTAATEMEYKERALPESLHQDVENLSSISAKIEALLKDYNRCLEGIPQVTLAEEEDYDTYESRALELLTEARKCVSYIKVTTTKVQNTAADPNQTRQNTEKQTSSEIETKLPPIPIPKFDGDIWEWEAFWGAYNHCVHSKNMDDCTKMTYLMGALEGKAKEYIGNYAVSGHSYAIVITRLKEKYGNKKSLINKLLDKLKTVKAESDDLDDQEILCESITAIVDQLRQNGEHVDNTFLQQEIIEKFTKEIRKHAIRRTRQSDEEAKSSTADLLLVIREYIREEIEVRNETGRPTKEVTEKATYHFNKQRQHYYSSSFVKTSYPCFYCEKKGHLPIDCKNVRTQEHRLRIMKQWNLCHNCGSKYHQTLNCKAGPCRICERKGHHTSICKEMYVSNKDKTHTLPKQKQPTVTRPTRFNKEEEPSTGIINAALSKDEDLQGIIFTSKEDSKDDDEKVLVGKARVLNPRTRQLEPIYVMLDTGANRTFITNQLAQKLQLKDIAEKRLTIHTFACPQPIEQTCGITTIQLYDNDGKPHTIRATRIESIVKSVPRTILTSEDKQYIKDHNIQLSVDPENETIVPQLILGCSNSLSMIQIETAKETILPSGMKLITSRFGHLMYGRKEKDINKTEEESVHQTEKIYVDSHLTEQQSWEDFCTLESSGVSEFTGSKEEEKRQESEVIWKKFEETIEKREDGYYVRLPWKDNANTLPANKGMAIQRLQSTVNKLKSHPTLFQQYHETIVQQLNQGIIEEVEETNNSTNLKEIIHYLSHHAVITPNKETTKLRVVFDASAHQKGQPSLNEVLHQGPLILPQICDILLRFRIGDIAIISDVEKAFLQIRLHEKDRDATRFLWIRDITKPCEPKNTMIFRFTRVTFGLNCSPFLLAATIKHHLENFANNEQLVKELKENTYVDNIILTRSSTNEAMKSYKETKNIFNELGMNLREFLSNDKAVMNQIIPNDRTRNTTKKVLGIAWHSDEDNLLISCNYPTKTKYTKRAIAEQVAAIYDPLGWMAPLTLKGKQFMQSLWKANHNWDATISEEEKEQWEKIIKSTDGFKISIPRQIVRKYEAATIVGFSDASRRTMAACAYIVSNEQSHLVRGKTKLVSIKDNPTIPKLELNALTMATRLAYSVYTAIADYASIKQIIIYTDSEIALKWIQWQNIGKSAGTLVKNRIKEIKRIVQTIIIPVKFGFVNTQDNPADCATRGLNKLELINHMWWKGPMFIQDTNQHEITGLITISEPTYKHTSILMTAQADEDKELLDWRRHNRLKLAQRTIAYVLRFIKAIIDRLNQQLKDRIQHNIPEVMLMASTPYITAAEYELALRVLVRNHQNSYDALIWNSPNQLNLYRDEHGIIRCRGRLSKACIPFNAQQPIFIVSRTKLAKMITQDAHLPYHSGTSQTMANVRQKFWIPKLRQQTRKVLRRCVACQKMNNLPYKYPNMDDLPESRVRRTRPFEHVGIDYFGPIEAKKNDTITKAYGLIINCATTRLIHLELVQSMSTEELLLALRRFFARRGVPTTITSDNGANLVLGQEIMREAIRSVNNDVSFAATMATKGITWKTITPYAPWQGAFYERLIKSVKYSLYKILQRTIITIEELETLLTEIEASLNTRPLTYQEESPDDFTILRPIDFIQKDIILTYPFEALTEQEDDPTYLPSHEAAQLRTRHQAQEALRRSHKYTEKFWTIWRQQYLTSLRELHKLTINNKKGTNTVPREGAVVLVSEPVAPRNTWKMGRVMKLQKSQNNTIREAQVKLGNGRIIRRPINALIPLELEDDQPQAIPEVTDKTDNKPSTDEVNVQSETSTKFHYNLRPRS